ncbi:MAG: class I SAM-dependent DNA methyltransferase [Chloroflexi bacterium]|nr:class I SAM-dependent DNA methyltransferase [Chloroflexota bacterium]
MTPQDFVTKWKRVTAREKQIYQEHFLDICQLVGHQTPNDYDPTGTRFAFEMGAAKTSGGQGWADVAKIGFFGWEYKGKDADLEKAYEQLLRYRDSLENPPLLIVSDINNIIIRTNYTNLATRTFTLTLDDLLNPESIKTLKTVFTNPEQLKPQETIESVTQEAAKQFSTLANVLRKFGEEPQEVAHFLIRLLFCLFAEDIGLLPEKLFPRLLEQTRRNSKDFAEVLKQLFRAMNTGGYFGADKILHFNGGLFDDDHVLQLDSDAMDIISDIDGLDWGAIKPSIFGTLFERGLDPSKRSQLGAHYTGEDDIILIVEPVLMKPLRDEWARVKDEVQKIKTEEEKAKDKKKKDLQKKIKSTLLAFADKIAAVKVLDPACGSANFLYVALRLLLDLQNEVLNFSDEMGAGRPYITVTPAQLYGIETNEYAHELAQMTIQIGYIQWLRDNGYGQPAEPILKKTNNIVNMDAILTPSALAGTSPKSVDEKTLKSRSGPDLGEDGRGSEPTWPAVDVIIGNPPFLGSIKQREELGEKYLDDLTLLYKDRVPPKSDFVCYWFEKSRQAIVDGKVKRVGLIATQAIRKGLSRTVLDRIKETGDIFTAYSNRPWVLDGASVRVSIICFDDGSEKVKILDDKLVETINPDLSSSADITTASVLSENENIAYPGTKKYGAFDIEPELAQKMLADKSNPNGKPNSDVIKPWVNGSDLVGNRRSMWIIDFGVKTPIEVAAQYQLPFEYVRKIIKPERDKERIASTRDNWWLFERQRPEMRQALSNLKRFIATPVVSKYRIFVWLSHPTIPDAKVTVFAKDDDYSFGILHSRLHEIWSLFTGSRHGDGGKEGGRPVYNISTCFETFPFPFSPGHEPKNDPRVKAVAQAAKELVEQRDRWLDPHPSSPKSAGEETSKLNSNADLGEVPAKAGGGGKRTLTNLYNQRPTWLDLAHKKLDEAVFAAYGWKNDLSDEEILEKLLALNLERSATTS